MSTEAQQTCYMLHVILGVVGPLRLPLELGPDKSCYNIDTFCPSDIHYLICMSLADYLPGI